MWATGGEGDEGVAGLNAATVDDVGTFHDANTEPGKVVIFTFVHPGHLSGLTTNQRGSRQFAAFANTRDYRRRNFHIEFARGVVVQKEQRFRAHHRDIIATHSDQIDTDGVVDTKVHRQLQFRADAVGA